MASSGTLERKISEARSKKDLLKARVQTAKTSNYVNEILGSMESGSSLAAYRQMEEKGVCPAVLLWQQNVKGSFMFKWA